MRARRKNYGANLRFISILLIQCIWSTTVVHASAPAVTAAELKKALVRYQSMESLEVPFKQTKTLKDIQLKLESEGLLKVHFPNRVEWKVLKPQVMDMILADGQITLKSDGQEQSFKASEGSTKDQRSFRDLLNWLKLDADALVKDYDITRLTAKQFRFTAKNTDSPIKALNMTMGPTEHLERLIFEETAGDEIRIEFGRPKVVSKKASAPKGS